MKTARFVSSCRRNPRRLFFVVPGRFCLNVCPETRYDEYAVLQIPRNIELLRYRRYGRDLLLLELVRASNTLPNQRRSSGEQSGEKKSGAEVNEPRPEEHNLQDVCEALKAFLLALGDDVQMKELEHYIAFRRLKNFACVKLRSKDLQVWARLDPATVQLEDGFTRDVSNLSHLGAGDLEIRVQRLADLERARPLVLRSHTEA